MGMGETTVELVTSCSRMMDLLGAPRDISFFGKLIQREIIYRLLQGSLGARLRAIAKFETRCHRVAIGQFVPDCRKQALELSSHSVIEDDLDRIRKISPDKRATVDQSDQLPACRQSGNYPETGFEPISLQLNDHTDRGVGGRQYGSSEDIETLQGKSNASASRFGAVEECGSSLTRRSQFARIIRPCHRRIQIG